MLIFNVNNIFFTFMSQFAQLVISITIKRADVIVATVYTLLTCTLELWVLGKWCQRAHNTTRTRGSSKRKCVFRKEAGLVDILVTVRMFFQYDERNLLTDKHVRGISWALGYLRLCRAPYLPLGRRTWQIHGTSCGPQNSKLQGKERDEKTVFREGEREGCG